MGPCVFLSCRKRLSETVSTCTLKPSKFSRTYRDRKGYFFEIPSKCLRLQTSSDLARFIILCRSDSQVASKLARFIVDLTACRKHEFSNLTVRDLIPDSASSSIGFSIERFVSDIFLIFFFLSLLVLLFSHSRFYPIRYV